MQHTVSGGHLRHTVILHHSYSTCISAHAGSRDAAIQGRLVSGILLGLSMSLSLSLSLSMLSLWIVHHVLLRLLARELLVLLVLVLLVGGLGLWRDTIGIIGIEGCVCLSLCLCRGVRRAITISRCIHGNRV